MTRHRDLLESPLLQRRLAIFTDAERVIADPVVRNRGTIGGALCQADPSEDLSRRVRGGRRAARHPQHARGERVVGHARVPPRSVRDRGRPGRDADRDPRPAAPRAGSAYLKVDRRVGDWAVVAAGAALDLDDGTIARAGHRARRRRRRASPRAEAEASLLGEQPTPETLRTRRGARRVRVRARDRPTRIRGLQTTRRRRPHGARPATRHRARTTDEGGVTCPPDGPWD